MTTDADGARAPLNHTRQVTIDALCEHFANDVMSVEDFEARVDVAHRATTVDELRELLRDLPSGNLPTVAGAQASPAHVGSRAPAPRRHSKENGYAVAVMGGARRAGQWNPARVNHTIAVMGGVELDFREAALPQGVTELKVYTVMGGVEIIVPPGLAVESHGIGIMGGFEHVADDERQAWDSTAPVLRISGIALLGGVDIKVRHAGESARDARRRRRQERRHKRKALRGRLRELKDDLTDELDD